MSLLQLLCDRRAEAAEPVAAVAHAHPADVTSTDVFAVELVLLDDDDDTTEPARGDSESMDHHA